MSVLSLHIEFTDSMIHTQDAGEVAQSIEASVGYGVHYCKALVSANCQPEEECSHRNTCM